MKITVKLLLLVKERVFTKHIPIIIHTSKKKTNNYSCMKITTECNRKVGKIKKPKRGSIYKTSTGDWGVSLLCQ